MIINAPEFRTTNRDENDLILIADTMVRLNDNIDFKSFVALVKSDMIAPLEDQILRGNFESDKALEAARQLRAALEEAINLPMSIRAKIRSKADEQAAPTEPPPGSPGY